MLGEPGVGLLLFVRGRVLGSNAKRQSRRDAGQVGDESAVAGRKGRTYATKSARSTKGAIAKGGETLRLGWPRF